MAAVATVRTAVAAAAATAGGSGGSGGGGLTITAAAAAAAIHGGEAGALFATDNTAHRCVTRRSPARPCISRHSRLQSTPVVASAAWWLTLAHACR